MDRLLSSDLRKTGRGSQFRGGEMKRVETVQRFPRSHPSSLVPACLRNWGKLIVALVLSLSTIASVISADNSQFPFGCPVREGYVNVTGGKVWYEIVGDSDATPLIVLHG